MARGQEHTTSRTGLLFGSFNPVHTGHLIIADHMLQHAGLDQVWFVLSPQNPKKENKLLAVESRLELLRLAIEGHPGFAVCDTELQMPRPSYTIRTLERLSMDHPDRRFVLLIGSDNLEVFDQWKDYRKILDKFDIYVYPRPGFHSPGSVQHPRIRQVNAPLLEISSTRIRESIRQGKQPRYLLPEKVWQRIKQAGYYA